MQVHELEISTYVTDYGNCRVVRGLAQVDPYRVHAYSPGNSGVTLSSENALSIMLSLNG